ncbi:MAG: nuclear transport factor 2 family protein [Ginsengibacter sp.]
METKEEKSLSTKKIVEDFYAALASRELDAVAKNFADRIDWHIPGESSLAPWLGKRTQRYEVKEFFEMLLQNIVPVSFELERIVTENNFAIATGHFVSKMIATGKNYESLFSAHFTIKNNLIVRYRFLEDSNALVKALKSE